MYDRILLIDHLTTNVMCRVEYLIWCGLHTLALYCSSSSYSCVSLFSLCQDDRDMVPRTVRELVIEYLIWCGHCTQLSSFDCSAVSAWVSVRWLSLSKVARNATKSSDNYLFCMFRLIGPNILIVTICVLIVHGRKSWLVIQEWYQSTSFVENEFSRYFSSNYCVSIPNIEVNLVYCLTRITWIGYMIVQSSFMQDGVSTFVQMIWLDRMSTNHISWPIPCRRKSNCTRVKNPRFAQVLHRYRWAKTQQLALIGKSSTLALTWLVYSIGANIWLVKVVTDKCGTVHIPPSPEEIAWSAISAGSL